MPWIYRIYIFYQLLFNYLKIIFFLRNRLAQESQLQVLQTRNREHILDGLVRRSKTSNNQRVPWLQNVSYFQRMPFIFFYSNTTPLMLFSEFYAFLICRGLLLPIFLSCFRSISKNLSSIWKSLSTSSHNSCKWMLHVNCVTCRKALEIVHTVCDYYATIFQFVVNFEM